MAEKKGFENFNQGSDYHYHRVDWRWWFGKTFGRLEHPALALLGLPALRLITLSALAIYYLALALFPAAWGWRFAGGVALPLFAYLVAADWRAAAGESAAAETAAMVSPVATSQAERNLLLTLLLLAALSAYPVRLLTAQAMPYSLGLLLVLAAQLLFRKSSQPHYRRISGILVCLIAFALQTELYFLGPGFLLGFLAANGQKARGIANFLLILLIELVILLMTMMSLAEPLTLLRPELWLEAAPLLALAPLILARPTEDITITTDPAAPGQAAPRWFYAVFLLILLLAALLRLILR